MHEKILQWIKRDDERNAHLYAEMAFTQSLHSFSESNWEMVSRRWNTAKDGWKTYLRNDRSNRWGWGMIKRVGIRENRTTSPYPNGRATHSQPSRNAWQPTHSQVVNVRADAKSSSHVCVWGRGGDGRRRDGPILMWQHVTSENTTKSREEHLRPTKK